MASKWLFFTINHQNRQATGGEPSAVIRLHYTSLLSATTLEDIFRAKNFIVWFKPLLSIIVYLRA